MSSAKELGQAYDSYLSTSDLASWTAALEAHRHVFDETTDLRAVRPIDLRRALTLSIYVAWLASYCGEEGERERVMREMHQLIVRITPESVRDAAEAVLIRAVIAAVKGYQGTARQLVAGVSELPVEVAVLTVRDQALLKARMLEPYIRRNVRSFVPALYYYGSALLDLGHQAAAQKLLEQSGHARSSSFFIDLDGQLLELEGAWRDAGIRYRGSEWAAHAYRHAVCELIEGAPVERLEENSPRWIARFTAGMGEFSAETDRAGVLRSASFTRACRWNGFDNWLVRFELGRISFQRRRHAEAERHLVAAARGAPGAFRFPILSLRATNLGWLGEAMKIDTEPEAIDAGEEALRQPATDVLHDAIRAWNGRFDVTSPVLDHVLTSRDDYLRGEAHSLRGNVPGAIAAWSSEISKQYTARAVLALIRVLAARGFERTAVSLAETAALESEDDFFEQWELASTLSDVLASTAHPRIDGDRLGQVLTAVEARVQVLVGSEFQNALRAFHHFVGRRLPEPAQRLLARLEALAEGPEELLLLAIARRSVGVGAGDPGALAALSAAARQSSDRLERLVIARELVHFGDLARARRILGEEGIFSEARDLTAIEYVLALTCAAACASSEERQRLGANAAAALKADLEAGRFASCGRRCLERLNDCLEGGALQLELIGATDRSDLEASAYERLVAELGEEADARGKERALRILNQQVETLSERGSLPEQLALLGLHLDRFDAQVKLIDGLRPIVPDDELPMRHDRSPIRKRATRLGELWRAHLQGEPGEAARLLVQIRTLRANERKHAERWERSRSNNAAVQLKFALGCAHQGAQLLRRISAAGCGEWPEFLKLRDAISEDTRQLSARLAQRASALEERMAR